MSYLDDVILGGNSLDEFTHVKTILNDSFLQDQRLGPTQIFSWP